MKYLMRKLDSDQILIGWVTLLVFFLFLASIIVRKTDCSIERPADAYGVPPGCVTTYGEGC